MSIPAQPKQKDSLISILTNTESTESFFNVDWDAEFSEEITDHQKELLRLIAKQVAKRDMTVPAIMFLETMRPFNFLYSQVMLFFEPYAAFIMGLNELTELRRALSKRECVEYLVTYIEEADRQVIDERMANKKPFFMTKIFKNLKNKFKKQ
jgi:hypothetical protein